RVPRGIPASTGGVKSARGPRRQDDVTRTPPTINNAEAASRPDIWNAVAVGGESLDAIEKAMSASADPEARIRPPRMHLIRR
ncbi:MAG: hypothetical protein ACE5OO_07725, partial [Candidatus Bathyarchaeia archaeon]